jgi:hypothetical protein
MPTPAQLRELLLGLGIDRDLRTLADWRQKGLLPPLERISLGRGSGVMRQWSDEVVDQAIAADWLMTRTGSAHEALLGLWLSGYQVEPGAAQQAWIEYLKRVQKRRERSASRYSGGYFGLWSSWWRRLMRTKAFEMPWWRELPEDYLGQAREFLGSTHDWLRNDTERDDADYRGQISELIARFAQANRKATYDAVDEIWGEIDPPSFFASKPYIELVESLSAREMTAAHASLVHVVLMLQHVLELTGPVDRVPRVVVTLMLMRDFLGTLVARAVIVGGRAAPELPVGQTIAAVHELVMGVQSTDISKKSDGRVQFSERVRGEWQLTKTHISQLWTAAAKNQSTD